MRIFAAVLVFENGRIQRAHQSWQVLGDESPDDDKGSHQTNEQVNNSDFSHTPRLHSVASVLSSAQFLKVLPHASTLRLLRSGLPNDATSGERFPH